MIIQLFEKKFKNASYKIKQRKGNKWILKNKNLETQT